MPINLTGSKGTASILLNIRDALLPIDGSVETGKIKLLHFTNNENSMSMFRTFTQYPGVQIPLDEDKIPFMFLVSSDITHIINDTYYPDKKFVFSTIIPLIEDSVDHAWTHYYVNHQELAVKASKSAFSEIRISESSVYLKFLENSYEFLSSYELYIPIIVS